MPRFTANLNDAQNDWLEARADEYDQSKAWVVRQLIDDARGEDVTITVQHGEDHTTPVQDGEDFTATEDVQALQEELDELRDRVDELEMKTPEGVLGQHGFDSLADLAARIYELEDRLEAREAPDSDDDTPTPHAPETPTETPADVEELVADAVDAVALNWEDDPTRLEQRRAAAQAVLQHAIDSGDAIGKTDAIEDFRPDYPVDGQNEETWWRKNVRPVLKAYGTYSQGAHGYRVTRDDLEQAGVYDPTEEFQ